MATLKPFRALRPRPDAAAAVCEPPYDVMNTEEARRMADGNPHSFLRVTRAEIEFPAGADPYSDEVYRRGGENLRRLVEEGALVREGEPVYLLYRLVMGDHSQLGLVAVASCAEYDAGIVRKHELTRPDKEDDRTRHINLLGAQTGPVFLTYRARPEIDALFAELSSGAPDIDFTAEDGVRHSSWIIRDAATAGRIEVLFGQVTELYIADGHHRSAAASRVARERAAADSAVTGEEPFNYFLTVTFPHNQMKILGYNRALRDLNGLSAGEFLQKAAEVGTITEAPADHLPRQKGEVSFFLGGKWHLLTWRENVARRESTVAELDVSILQDALLAPILAIGDPRLDKRISFVGGIRGTAELEKLVNSGDYAVAFALHPTSVEDLMRIADANGLMPPKSTWFEPKLRDAMAVHLIDD